MGMQHEVLEVYSRDGDVNRHLAGADIRAIPGRPQ